MLTGFHSNGSFPTTATSMWTAILPRKAIVLLRWFNHRKIFLYPENWFRQLNTKCILF